MPNILICTICSRKKRTDVGTLPAIDRYVSDRIDKVGKIAKRYESPFAILSGEYGLLKPNDEIPYYDHLLLEGEVEELIKKVVLQIENFHVDEIEFYAKSREANWIPYYLVLEGAAKALSMKLTVIPCED